MKYFYLGLALLALPAVSFAAAYEPMVALPGISAELDMGEYINALYLVSISIAAILAVLKIIIAGIKYMLSDVVTDNMSAKSDIKGALLGLLIILAAVIILNTINPQLTFLDIFTTAENAAPSEAEVILVEERSPEALLLDGIREACTNVNSLRIAGEVFDCSDPAAPTAILERLIEILEATSGEEQIAEGEESGAAAEEAVAGGAESDSTPVATTGGGGGGINLELGGGEETAEEEPPAAESFSDGQF